MKRRLATRPALRQDERFSKIPIIMLTALNGEKDQVKGLNAGADVYLTKPVNLPQLTAILSAPERHKGRLATS